MSKIIPLRHKITKVVSNLPEKYLEHPVFGHLLEVVRSDKPLDETKSAKTLREVTPTGALERVEVEDEPVTPADIKKKEGK